ncbi:hypothetical protein BpHYR1_043655, partial [Brachionus plicatilis]
FPVSLWNLNVRIKASLPRTNRNVESWRSRINSDAPKYFTVKKDSELSDSNKTTKKPILFSDLIRQEKLKKLIDDYNLIQSNISYINSIYDSEASNYQQNINKKRRESSNSLILTYLNKVELKKREKRTIAGQYLFTFFLFPIGVVKFISILLSYIELKSNFTTPFLSLYTDLLWDQKLVLNSTITIT